MPGINQATVGDGYTAAATVQDVFTSTGGWFSVSAQPIVLQLQWGPNASGSRWSDEQTLGAGAFGTIPPGCTGIRFRNLVAGSAATVTAYIGSGGPPPDPRGNVWPEPALAISALGNVSATVTATPVPLVGAEIAPATVSGAFTSFSSSGSPALVSPISSFIPGIIGGVNPVYTQFRFVAVLRILALNAATALTLSLAAQTFTGVREFSASSAVATPLTTGEKILDFGWNAIPNFTITESLELVYSLTATGGPPTVDFLQASCWIKGG